MAAARGKQNDTDPMGDPANMDDSADDVDDMLNALEVSRPRQRKQPSHADANEANGRGQTQKMGGPARRPAGGGGATMPMMGAPQLPKEAVNAKVASDPVERAFLNRTEETAPRRRRDEKTMLTAQKKSGGGYFAAALIGFAAVLFVGAVAWKMMRVVASQGPASQPTQLAPAQNTNAPATTSTATTAAITTTTTTATATATSTPTATATPTPTATANATATATAASTSTAATTTPTITTATPNATQNATAATDIAAPAKSAPAPRASGAKQPESKYGNVVAPEL
jgi:hypothetical protein